MGASTANVLDQAQNVQGVVAAARKRDAWSRKEANATDDGDRRLYREAIFDLEQRFPDLADVPVGGAEKFARERGHGRGSRSPVHEGRRRSRPGSPTPKKKPAAPKKSSPRGKVRPAGPPRRASRPTSPTPRVDRAIAQTGIPAAAGSTGSMVMAALGGTVGLSLGYLVLSSAEQKGSGMKAFPTLVEGVTRAIGRFLGTGDVFAGNRPAAPAKTGTPQPTAPVHPRGHGARPQRTAKPHQLNHR